MSVNSSLVIYIIQQAYGFHACAFRVPTPLAEGPPLFPPRPGRGRGARGGSRPSGIPPVQPHRLNKISDYRLIILTNRVDADSISCGIQRNSIIEQLKPTAQHQRSAAKKEAVHNTSTAPTLHPLPGHRQNTTRVPLHTPIHRPSHQPTHQPTHPPCCSSPNSKVRCFVPELGQSRPVIKRREQNIPKTITAQPP